MIIAIAILIISFLAITAMLTAGHYESKAGRQFIAVGAREWIEREVRRGAHAVRDIIRTAASKHFWTGLFSYLSRKFVEKVLHHPHMRRAAKKATDVVRGKKEIKSKGPVSFYLKDVSDHKNRLH